VSAAPQRVIIKVCSLEIIAMTSTLFPELGFYLLPGHTATPADLITEVIKGEQLGMGSAWISERFDAKEIAVCVGAAGAVTNRIFIGTGATNISTRHVMTTAAMATTASLLTKGRFALGIARGVGIRYDSWGIQGIKNQHMRDFIDIMRKLWKGERVMGYDGVLGKFPYLHLTSWMNEDIPLLFVGFGEKSLEFAGSVFDGVVLHTFFSDEAMKRAVAAVRRGAEKAGRDPSSVKIWSVVAVACNPTDAQRHKYLTARMATYLQAPGYGELLIQINGWDNAVLEQFRAAPIVKGMLGSIDSVATTEQLEEISQLIPAEWLQPAAAGTPEQCAAYIHRQFDVGADGVILHASTPAEFEPVLEPYAKLRDGARFAGRTERPC